jgi:hypothetical protein
MVEGKRNEEGGQNKSLQLTAGVKLFTEVSALIELYMQE